MSSLSPSELETVRLHPQETTLYLSIFTPTVAMAALVSGTPAKESQQIPYRNVSEGSYLSIESGMTLLVGTTPGGRELGKIRVRSATSTHLIVSENSSINWPNAVYLTVLRYWEVWPVYPRIINDPNNVENVIFYKDYDIAYTNQNSILGSLQCAGSHLAGWVGDSFYFTSTGTTHLLGSAITHDWAFEGATVTGSTSATPGNITWNAPGHYVVRYKTTGANGSVDTTYRYVSIYNRPENSSQNNPIKRWEVGTVSGGRDEGGYSSTIRIIDEIAPINEGDVVVLFSDNWYGNQNISLGSNTSNPKVFFVGHILNNSINFDYKRSITEFEVGSITILSKSIEGFSISVESKPSPSTWFELLDMDGRRAMYHYLRWQSTLLLLSDFLFVGTDQKIQYFDSDRGSIYDAIDNYMRGALEGKVVSDLQGRVYAEISPWNYTNPTGSFPTVMTITKRDWVGEPNITERLTPTTSFIERGGVVYSGSTTGTFNAIISQAPGSTPAFRGGEDKQQGLALGSQSQLNRLTGNLLAQRNAQFPQVSMNLSGNYRNLDIAPQTSVLLDIQATDTNRNVAISSPYIIERMSWNYNPKNKILIPEVTFGIVINGFTGETIRIPEVAEVANGGGFNVPSFRIPGINPFIPTVPSGGAGRYWVGESTMGGAPGSATSFSDYTTRVGSPSTYLNNDTSLVSITGPSGTYPTINESGLYHVDVHAYGTQSPVLSALLEYVYDENSGGGVYDQDNPSGDAWNGSKLSFTRYFTAGESLEFRLTINKGGGGSSLNFAITLTIHLLKIT